MKLQGKAGEGERAGSVTALAGPGQWGARHAMQVLHAALRMHLCSPCTHHPAFTSLRAQKRGKHRNVEPVAEMVHGLASGAPAGKPAHDLGLPPATQLQATPFPFVNCMHAPT